LEGLRRLERADKETRHAWGDVIRTASLDSEKNNCRGSGWNFLKAAQGKLEKVRGGSQVGPGRKGMP